MESEHPRRSEPTTNSQFPSTLVQDSTIPGLPPELSAEILSRLPVKSLLQLRSVSKSWLALISSPEFIKTHLRFSSNNKKYTHHMLTLNVTLDASGLYEYIIKDIHLRFLFHDSVTEAFDLDYPVKSNGLNEKLHRSVSLVGSVHGMICLAIDDYDLFLWNPSIRKYKSLPDSRPMTKSSACWTIYGFGYDEIRDDYKVVAVSSVYDSSYQAKVKIYSLKSDSWRSVDDCPSRVPLNAPGKLVNGKLHWSTNTTAAFVSKNLCKDWKIVSFDLADERWGKVEQPCFEEGDALLWLGVLGSDLSVFSIRACIDIWVMKEYGVNGTWTKFTMEYLDHVVPPAFMSNKGAILVGVDSTFMIYNSKDESFEYSEIIYFDSWRETEIYAESLVCPFSTKRAENATKTKTGKALIETI